MNNSQLYVQKRTGRYKGSAIIETITGLLVLMPIFLILIDIIALVIGQTINEDIAKKAARYASQGSDQPSAATYANNYMSSLSYSGPTGLVNNARIIEFNWSSSQVRVITQVTINLPVAVPFGGPSSQVMQAQFTEATVGVSVL